MNKDILKRLQRSKWMQRRDCKCIICGRGFETCSHSMVEVELTILSYKVLDKLAQSS